MVLWFPVRVAGNSMSPAYWPGDLLAVRPLRAGEPSPGQVVVARRDGIEVVKRVHATMPDGVDLRGDDPSASTDSRAWGLVPRDDIAGVVAFRYWPLIKPGR